MGRAKMVRTMMMRMALALLKHTGGGAYGDAYREALSGDLLEELERTGEVGVFWRAVTGEVLRGVWGRWLQPMVFSMGWSLCYPVWRGLDGGRLSTVLAQRGFAMAFPYSSMMLLASAGLSPLLFVWLGALVYMLRNQAKARNQMAGDPRSAGYVETLFRVGRGLSLGLSVLLVAAMVMLSARGGADRGMGHGGEDEVAAEVSHRGSTPGVTLSLMLSLMAATLSARPPRARLWTS